MARGALVVVLHQTLLLRTCTLGELLVDRGLAGLPGRFSGDHAAGGKASARRSADAKVSYSLGGGAQEREPGEHRGNAAIQEPLSWDVAPAVGGAALGQVSADGPDAAQNPPGIRAGGRLGIGGRIGGADQRSNIEGEIDYGGLHAESNDPPSTMTPLLAGLGFLVQWAPLALVIIPLWLAWNGDRTVLHG
uniref:Uncharacterized protein n=1 Tax=Zooxanthella nutricula TaxID=1333877 RepID=A0A6U6G2B8_9DINO|mmetsp:Transcript_100951/g.308703  ORF Transcript_100951/g.308703 Transcript_100951/m.308703 type:complete len:191 (+) Transcript_100951:103-675(+)|eukprot:CAMPEP_0198572098 /NCGR_PEP_ID=MMETSP1462-20131121/111392_1 /TAXON_ID=1333877 /ORGANISM="Brandtodinium nutriculum, Strain RCC3387" /LENGTH=190 /DNA_ID=CAMNT_0044303249 /DNA_START=85 /DNA_END=657 /DNA_ORIENTATION=+